MSFREFIAKLRERREQRNAVLKQALEEDKVRTVVEERKKSSNEREYDRFLKEEREETIKGELERFRKERDADIRFGHNPLNTPNITNHVDWEVLKERNIFANDNKHSIMRVNSIFTGQRPKYRNRPKWLRRNDNG
jgi:hypothetical protein